MQVTRAIKMLSALTSPTHWVAFAIRSVVCLVVIKTSDKISSSIPSPPLSPPQGLCPWPRSADSFSLPRHLSPAPQAQVENSYLSEAGFSLSQLGPPKPGPSPRVAPTGSVLGTHVCIPSSGRADLHQCSPLSFGSSESCHTTFTSLGRELDGRCHTSTLQGTDMKFVSLGSGGEGSPRPLPHQLSHFSPPTPSYILDAGERL